MLPKDELIKSNIIEDVSRSKSNITEARSFLQILQEVGGHLLQKTFDDEESWRTRYIATTKRLLLYTTETR